MYRNTLLFISSFLLNIAFFWPTLFSWLVFFCLVPLFYTALNSKLSFKQGLFWGLSFFCVHFFELFLLFIKKGHGLIKLGAWIFLTFNCALYAGVWFLVAGYFQKKLHNVVWLVTTWLYFWWVEKGVLLFSGHLQGYCFASPLLPLVQQPQWLYFLPVFTDKGFLFLLILTNWLLVHFLVGKQKKFLYGVLIILSPFLLGWIVYQQGELPGYVSTIGYVQPPENTQHPRDCAQEITYALTNYHEQHRDKKIIVMPETTFPFALNKHTEAISMWYAHGLDPSIAIILGSHRQAHKGLFNTLFFLKECRIIYSYDKKHRMLFTEFTPNLWAFLNNELFLKNKTEFSLTKQTKEPSFIINNTIRFTPLICSDLFYGHTSNSNNKYPYICLVNDSWFTLSYMKNLMFLYARMKAIIWKTDILYVGHYYATWITKYGNNEYL